MAKKYDEFGIEIKKNSKIPLIIFILTLTLLVFLGIVLIQNNIKEKKETENGPTDTNKSENKPNMDENSSFNEDASLVIPKIANTILYKIDSLDIKVTDLTADKNGYLFTVTAANTSNAKLFLFNCNKITIDNFETSANFNFVLSPNSQEQIKVRIPLEELNNLEIIDFNKLTFFLTITEGENIQTTTREIRMIQNIEVDNSKKGLLKIDEKNNVLINYYKKIEDETDTYLYFEIENNSKTNQVLKIKKLMLNNKIYTIKDFKQDTYHNTKNIFYIKVPKEEFETITKLRVSFFLLDPNLDRKATYITVEKELSILH